MLEGRPVDSYWFGERINSDSVLQLMPGDSTTAPAKRYAAVIKIGGPGGMGVGRNLYLLPSSPVAGLKKRLPKAQIEAPTRPAHALGALPQC